jgi:NADH-quinone oxidoreductase subunit J
MGLALTSVVLTIAMFRLDSPLAAVFELSVCTGLISVVFISAIALTHPLNQAEVLDHMKARLRRFWYLPLIVICAAIALSLVKIKFDLKLPAPEEVNDARLVLWNLRRMDLLGQLILLLTGVFGIVILFKERKEK